MSELAKQFNFSEALNNLSTQPHTVEARQFRRGLGDVVVTYRAGFRIENVTLSKLTARIAELIEELAGQQIRVGEIEITHLRAHELDEATMKAIINNAKAKVKANVWFELITPDVAARYKATNDMFDGFARDIRDRGKQK